MEDVTRIVIIGGGPGGYEAALVAAQLGAEVTVIERDGPGGACVLTDCVPSKTLIATSTRMTGDVRVGGPRRALRRRPGRQRRRPGGRHADVNKRVKDLARAQSFDIAERLAARGCKIVRGRGGWSEPHVVARRRPATSGPTSC